MKILFLSITVPFPATDGGRIRVLNLLTQVSKTDQITFLGLETAPTDQEGIAYLESLGIACHLVENQASPPKISLGTITKSLIQRKPITVARYDISSYRRELGQLIQLQNFDLIHYEMFHTAQFFAEVDLPKVLSTQNIDSYIWARLSEEAENPAKKIVYLSQKRAFRRYEKLISPKFSITTCVSETDRDWLRKSCPDSQTDVIPNGVDLDLYQPSHDEIIPDTLLYTGSMDWFPNEDAVIYCVNEILPVIRLKCPNVRFLIVGQHPTGNVRKLSDLPNIEVTGRVEDVKPYIAQSAVYVVPLRIGGGTRLKILEALAMEKAVVSTSVGAEGLELINNQEVVIEDNPMQFAARVVELLGNPDRCRQLGRKGRSRVQREYGWKAIGEKLRSVYTSLSEKPKE